MTENKAASLVARIHVARTKAKELDAATDDMNAALGQAERAMIDLRLGVSVSVRLEHDGDWDVDLAFRKHDGKWSLLVEIGPDDQAEWNVTPLLKASRQHRVMAAESLPALVDALIERTVTQAADIRKTTSEVRALVAELKNAAPRGAQAGDEEG